MSEIVNGNPQNENPHKNVRTRSTFPLQYHAFDTFRFGEYHPHFVMEGVAKDKISFRSSHDLRSYTLGAPLMEDISMKKDYFHVPMTAILPLNWDKFFANPVKGQDVLLLKVSIRSITVSWPLLLTDSVQSSPFHLLPILRSLPLCSVISSLVNTYSVPVLSSLLSVFIAMSFSHI